MKTIILSTAIAIGMAALFSPAKVNAAPTGTDCYNAFMSCMQGDKGNVPSPSDRIRCERSLEYCLDQVRN